MDTSLVPSEKKLIKYPSGYDGKYASFEVGYAGDKAGIRFDFVKAVISQGTQHLKHRERPFQVVTTSDLFNLDSLKEKLKLNMPESDRAVLEDGHKLLENFIQRNGKTNPASVEDFECSPA